MYYMFNNCSSLTSLDLGDKFDTSNVTIMESMFSGCSSLTSLDLGDKFDTSSVTTMYYMFHGCSSLISLDLGDNFDTGNVTNMSYMFLNCSSLTSLDLGDNFDTSSVTNMSSMFKGCSSLTSLDLGNFDTSSVTNMSSMFHGCSSLTNLDLGDKFDTSNVTNMSYMFSGCSSLTSLDLGDKFDTSKVTSMGYMFRDCGSLTSLDLSSFNTSNVTNMSYMFYGCTNLQTIYASNNFDTSSVTSSGSMFSSATKLVGGNGTVYSSSHVDKEYARIDTASTPGYFTSYLQPRVATRATTNSINVIVTMDSSYGTITKYEFSKDGGTTWVNNGTNKTYNFTGLTKETTYNIMVRVTDSSNNTYTSTSRPVTTLALSTPTFKQKNNSTTSVDVTITYPSGCGSTLTCTYKKNNGSSVTVTSKTTVVNYSAAGTLTASVTDGTNTVGSSYTVTMPSGVLNTNGVSIALATSGDGLYNNGDGTYTFKGEDPNNYLKLGNDDYRIIGIENGMLKVIKTTSLGNLSWDPGYSTSITGITSSSSTDGTRFQGLSSNTTDYCVSSNTTASGSGYYGCKSWGSKTTTLNSSGTNVTVMPKIADNATTYNLPSDEAYLNVYLNGGTYQGVSITGWIDGLSYKSLIETHTFNVGPVKSTSGQTLATDISQASAYKWSGKVGLMTVIDYVKANTNTSLCGTVNLSNSSANAATCKAANWLATSSSQWTMSPSSTSYSYYVWSVSSAGYLSDNNATNTRAVRPVFYLKSNVQLTGEGTSGSGAYTIAS